MSLIGFMTKHYYYYFAEKSWYSHVPCHSAGFWDLFLVLVCVFCVTTFSWVKNTCCFWSRHYCSLHAGRSSEREVRNAPHPQHYRRVVSSFLEDTGPFTPSLVEKCLGLVLPVSCKIHASSCALSSSQCDLKCPGGFQRIFMALCPPLNCNWAT